MTARHLFSVFALGALALGACTNEENLGNRDAAATPGGDASAGMPVFPTGTLFGKTFTPTSGLAVVGSAEKTGCDTAEVVNLVFSSEADTCDAFRSRKLAPGTIIVSVFSVCGTSLGSHESDDGKAGMVDPSCATGTDVNGAASALDHDGPARVTFTRVDANRVEGSLLLLLKDGSSFEGSFSVPTCAGARFNGDGPPVVCK